MSIQFNVNGRPASTNAPGTTPLLWVIREGLKLSGTKFGCGAGSSIVYGLGMLLSERISYKDGAVEQSNLYDYLVPRMNEIPQMHIAVIATDNHPTGVGQMATPLVAPAISSAVADLAGMRLRHSPFTPERVKQALG